MGLAVMGSRVRSVGVPHVPPSGEAIGKIWPNSLTEKRGLSPIIWALTVRRELSDSNRLARLSGSYYNALMKTLTVRLPEALAAEIEAESRERQRSKSDVVRERLSLAARARSGRAPPDAIADLVGSVDGLPADLSARKKAYLKATGYGRKRAR